MLQRIVDGRFEIADFLAGVVPLSFKHIAVEVAAPRQLAQRIGELNLAARSASCLFENRENLVAAIHFVLGAPATAGETYVVADPEPLTAMLKECCR